MTYIITNAINLGHPGTISLTVENFWQNERTQLEHQYQLLEDELQRKQEHHHKTAAGPTSRMIELLVPELL